MSNQEKRGKELIENIMFFLIIVLFIALMFIQISGHSTTYYIILGFIIVSSAILLYAFNESYKQYFKPNKYNKK